MNNRMLLASLSTALSLFATNAVGAADDTVTETNTMDRAAVVRELNDLRRIATNLDDRINALENALAGTQPNSNPMPPMALDGFCPVELIDNDRWVRGSANVAVVHRGRTYLFKDSAARSKFLTFPDRYRPIFDGSDPIAWIDNSEQVPGRREHGVSYAGRIYLFANELNLEKFLAAPKLYAKRVDNAPPISVSLNKQRESQELDSADLQRTSGWPTQPAEAISAFPAETTSGKQRTRFCAESRTKKRVRHRRAR